MTFDELSIKTKYVNGERMDGKPQYLINQCHKKVCLIDIMVNLPGSSGSL